MLQAWKGKESQCRRCKNIFLHTDEHAYKGCCSWNCLCRLREQEEHEKKARGVKTIIRTEAQALARIEVCKGKIEYFKERCADPTISERHKKSTYSSLYDWRCKLNDAERTLLVIRGEIDA